MVPGHHGQPHPTGQLLERRVFVGGIEDYIAHNNDNPGPLIWPKTSGEIIAKVRRGRGWRSR